MLLNFCACVRGLTMLSSLDYYTMHKGVHIASAKLSWTTVQLCKQHNTSFTLPKVACWTGCPGRTLCELAWLLPCNERFPWPLLMNVHVMRRGKYPLKRSGWVTVTSITPSICWEAGSSRFQVSSLLLSFKVQNVYMLKAPGVPLSKFYMYATVTGLQ